MGDRANIYLFDDDHWATEGALPPRTGIFLYTHWNGTELPQLLRQALTTGEPRWDDPSYLARIIMSGVFAENHDGTMGAGLSTRITDNEWPLLCVDLLESQVGLCDPDLDPHNRQNWTGVRTFREYVNADEISWEALRQQISA